MDSSFHLRHGRSVPPSTNPPTKRCEIMASVMVWFGIYGLVQQWTSTSLWWWWWRWWWYCVWFQHATAVSNLLRLLIFVFKKLWRRICSLSLCVSKFITFGFFPLKDYLNEGNYQGSRSIYKTIFLKFRTSKGNDRTNLLTLLLPHLYCLSVDRLFSVNLLDQIKWNLVERTRLAQSKKKFMKKDLSNTLCNKLNIKGSL